jgi:hypothetical protein
MMNWVTEVYNQTAREWQRLVKDLCPPLGFLVTVKMNWVKIRRNGTAVGN